ncbi:MAG: hypothetical protein UW66_C0006G0009 [Candidatus Moranbacteria bacterium GW2011_GWF1_44_4]|nr:MAG: hypothetical protein UW66_C0006G0009 [Candidatus Moranbacteria bacterium GW2011_GWF1_44_4]OGI22377.1 MAG: hypothetical protein A2194_00985 [Candidatus Moranbacteria bacterium RIFOXYA1_FULL_44_8]
MNNSDVRLNGCGRTVVFQPTATVGMGKAELGMADMKFFEELITGILDMDFAHVATLQWQSDSISGQSRCGGKLIIKKLIKKSGTYDGGYHQNAAEKVRFTCSNPKCGLNMVPKIPLFTLRSSFLHLLLKQMVPGYQSANFFNCLSVVRNDGYCSHNQLGDEGWESIRKMGTITMLGKVLWGVERNFYKNECFAFKDYDFSLLAVEGLNTSEGCDGLDRWLQFLVCKLQKLVGDLIGRIIPLAIGPKKSY